MDGSSVIFIVIPIVIPQVILAGHRPAVSRASLAEVTAWYSRYLSSRQPCLTPDYRGTGPAAPHDTA